MGSSFVVMLSVPCSRHTVHCCFVVFPVWLMGRGWFTVVLPFPFSKPLCGLLMALPTLARSHPGWYTGSNVHCNLQSFLYFVPTASKTFTNVRKETLWDMLSMDANFESPRSHHVHKQLATNLHAMVVSKILFCVMAPCTEPPMPPITPNSIFYIFLCCHTGSQNAIFICHNLFRV